MPEKSDEYLDHARHCRQMAEMAHSPELKAGWLELAQNWLEMESQLRGSSEQPSFPRLSSAQR